MRYPPLPGSSRFDTQEANPGLEDFLIPGKKRWEPVRASRMNAHPYRSIAGLFFQHGPQDLRFAGTAWFIAPKFLITAAHVVNQSRNIPLMAAFGGVSSAGIKMPQSSLVGAMLFNDPNPRVGAHNDIALLWLGPNKRSNSWLRFAKPKRQGNARIIGAQFSRHQGALGTTLFEDSGRYLANQGHNLAYDIDTQRGQSGAPILNTANVVIGIHQAGKHGFGSQTIGGVELSKLNKGLAFDQFHIDWLQQRAGAN